MTMRLYYLSLIVICFPLLHVAQVYPCDDPDNTECDFILAIGDAEIPCPGEGPGYTELVMLTTSPGDYWLQITGDDFSVTELWTFQHGFNSYSVPQTNSGYLVSIWDQVQPVADCVSCWTVDVFPQGENNTSVVAGWEVTEPDCYGQVGIVHIDVDPQYFVFESWADCETGNGSTLYDEWIELELPSGIHCLEMEAAGCISEIEVVIPEGEMPVIIASIEADPICDHPALQTVVQCVLHPDYDNIDDFNSCDGDNLAYSIETNLWHYVTPGIHCLEIIADGCTQILEYDMPFGPPAQVDFFITEPVDQNNEGATVAMTFNPAADYYGMDLDMLPDTDVDWVHVENGFLQIEDLESGSYVLGGQDNEGYCDSFEFFFEIPEYVVPPPSPVDFDDNGLVNIDDLLLLLGNIGCSSDCGSFDLNNDGLVNVFDLLEFLTYF